MDIRGKRLLAIGGAGLVGSHIVDQLLDEDVKEIVIFDNFVRGIPSNIENAVKDSRVKVVEGDMRNMDLVMKTLEGADGVFLLAALWLLQCHEDPKSCMDVNVNGTFNVVEACRALKVNRVVYSSSASVYGDAISTPMTEDHPFNNRTMYGASKIFGEQLFRAYHTMYGLNYVGLRYMNVYGPRQDYRGAYVSVIMKALDRIDRGEPPLIFGDGSQSYDFIYVGDVAGCNIQAMKSDVTDDCFNVGMEVKTSINELVELILKLTGSPLKPEYKPQEQSFVTHRVGSAKKCIEKLGYEAKYPLEEGLKKLIEWRKRRIEKEGAQTV